MVERISQFIFLIALTGLSPQGAMTMENQGQVVFQLQGGQQVPVQLKWILSERAKGTLLAEAYRAQQSRVNQSSLPQRSPTASGPEGSAAPKELSKIGLEEISPQAFSYSIKYISGEIDSLTPEFIAKSWLSAGDSSAAGEKPSSDSFDPRPREESERLVEAVNKIQSKELVSLGVMLKQLQKLKIWPQQEQQLSEKELAKLTLHKAKLSYYRSILRNLRTEGRY